MASHSACLDSADRGDHTTALHVTRLSPCQPPASLSRRLARRSERKAGFGVQGIE